MARISEVVVLAEDQRHQRLIRRYLEMLGNRIGPVRYEDLPSGRGCGERWVREHYSRAVKAYRWRSWRAQSALVVMIDADTEDMRRRTRQLENSLIDAKLPQRTNDERIVQLIPKRNIETWILNLNGIQVDETLDHRHDPEMDDQISSASETLFEWARSYAVIPDLCVSSLRLAIGELKRLE